MESVYRDILRAELTNKSENVECRSVREQLCSKKKRFARIGCLAATLAIFKARDIVGQVHQRTVRNLATLLPMVYQASAWFDPALDNSSESCDRLVQVFLAGAQLQATTNIQAVYLADNPETTHHPTTVVSAASVSGPEVDHFDRIGCTGANTEEQKSQLADENIAKGGFFDLVSPNASPRYVALTPLPLGTCPTTSHGLGDAITCEAGDLGEESEFYKRHNRQFSPISLPRGKYDRLKRWRRRHKPSRHSSLRKQEKDKNDDGQPPKAKSANGSVTGSPEPSTS